MMPVVRALALLVLAVLWMTPADALRCITCRSTREESCPVLLDTGAFRSLRQRPCAAAIWGRQGRFTRSSIRALRAAPQSSFHPPPPAARPLPAGVPVPVARKEPKHLKASPSFLDALPRVDNYAWMRDGSRNSSAVLSHLQASQLGGACAHPTTTGVPVLLGHPMPSRDQPVEPQIPLCGQSLALIAALWALPQEENAYAEAVLAPSQQLQQRLWREMLGRIPREESSMPQVRESSNKPDMFALQTNVGISIGRQQHWRGTCVATPHAALPAVTPCPLPLLLPLCSAGAATGTTACTRRASSTGGTAGA